MDFKQESGESDGDFPSSSDFTSGQGNYGGSKVRDSRGGAGEGANESDQAESTDSNDKRDEKIVKLDLKQHPLLCTMEASTISKILHAVVDIAVTLIADGLVNWELGEPLPLVPPST